MSAAVFEASAVTTALGGWWYGSYGLACCPVHADTTPSLTIGTGRDGRLLLHCKAGCIFAEVMDALRWRGIAGGTGYAPAVPHHAIEKALAEYARKIALKAEMARNIWDQAVPIAGTAAERYLRKRGITCALPESLRFHPSLRHPTGEYHPARIARIDGAPAFAVHRVFIRSDGSGKAEVQPAKVMLGTTRGGAVQVFHSDTGPLVVAEGIETALSLACDLLTGPVTIWAALSATNMSRLNLPPKPGRLIVGTDGDAAGRSNGHSLAQHAAGLGWTVHMLGAPEEQDWNDVLVAQVAAKERHHG